MGSGLKFRVPAAIPGDRNRKVRAAFDCTRMGATEDFTIKSDRIKTLIAK
jgi:hypothetical protein